MNIRVVNGIQAIAAGALIFSAGTALPQFAGPAVATATQRAHAPSTALNATYANTKIEPGDIIAISTYGAPELTTASMTNVVSVASPNGSGSVSGIKVGDQGEIVLPYVGIVKVAGMTPVEASEFLAGKLKDGGFLVDPQVTVRLVDSPTRVVTVVGEVQKPAPVQVVGQLRLLDVISACGGFTPLASHTVTIRRPGDPQPITVILGNNPNSTDESNIPLMAGDTVIVSKVGNVFVIGQVKNPEAIPLSSNMPITVLRAISMSGGVNFGAALSKVTIIRTTPNNQHVEISMDLKKVMNGKEKDVALMSDDVLVVPTNGFKAGLSSAGNGVASGLTNGLIYKLP